MSDSGISRRDVLKRGAITTGALIAGGTAISGTAAAHQCPSDFPPNTRACAVRFKKVRSCSGKRNPNGLQGGRKATIWTPSCENQEQFNPVYQVVCELHEEDSPGWCDEDFPGNVNCYVVELCKDDPNFANRVICVRGRLKEGDYWQATETWDCSN